MASSVKKRRARAVESNLTPPEVRSLPLTLDEAESLLDAVTRVGRDKVMAGRLRTLVSSFADAVLRLHELEVRLRASSFWESGDANHPANPYLRPIKVEQKYRKGQVLKELNSLGVAAVKPLVNPDGEKTKRGKPRKLAK